MATRFLRSKITAPTLHLQIVDRSRLTDLVLGTRDPLILVSAPAGYGKTTLLVNALSASASHVAWVSVDSADNDPLRFWTHVAASILGEGPTLDEIAAKLAASTAERQTVLDQLVTEIEDIGGPVVLVLDDLHEITSTEVFDALSRVLANPPKNLQVIASTRVDPALPTARLRSQSRLTEIRASDLAFTVDEAAHVFGTNADHEALRTIVARTEGWATALRLLEVASTTARSGPELLDAAGGAHPDLADFLSEEALQVQRPQMQQFLLETALLNDLTPTVCDTVTGRPGSLPLLRELASNQVFTVLVEPSTNTFRYHQLFREFLRSRAQELPEPARRERAQRAADHYAENEQISEAIRLALAANNDDMVIALILDYHMPFAQAGWIVTVFEWLNAFGAERVAQEVDLSVLSAWALLNMRQYAEIEEALAAPALADPTVDSRYGPIGSQIQAIRSHRDRHLGDLVGSHHEAEAGMCFTDDTTTVARCVVGAANGLAKTLLGLDGTGDFERAVAVGLSEKIDSSAVVGYSGLAFQASNDPQRLDEAVGLADQALAFCTTPALMSFHQPALALLVKARGARAQGRIGDALRYGERALAIATESIEPAFALLAHIELARIAHVQGDAGACRTHLRAGEALHNDESGDYLAAALRSARNDTRFASLSTRTDLPLGANDITDRELAVLRLLPHRLSRKELAEQLFISENTLKTHLTSLRHKLGVPGRADITARAVELGLLEPGG